MDEAGAVSFGFDPDRNVRRILVSLSQPENEPIMTVTCTGIDTIVVSTPDTLVIADVPLGISLECCWSVNASGSRGNAAGYRYGWDVLDPGDDSQWDISWSPFNPSIPTACSPARTFFFGTHTFRLQVLYDSGLKVGLAIRFVGLPYQ